VKTAHAGLLVAVVLACGSVPSAETFPRRSSGQLASVRYLVMTDLSGALGTEVPPPGTVVYASRDRPVPSDIQAKLEASFASAGLVRTRGEVVQLAPNIEQRLRVAPHGPGGTLSLISVDGKGVTVRLRLGDDETLFADASVVVPRGGYTVVSAPDGQRAHFVVFDLPDTDFSLSAREEQAALNPRPRAITRVSPAPPESGGPPPGTDLVVILDVTIDEAGVPGRIRRVEGPKHLEKIAIEAVAKWRFEAGLPKPMRTLIGLNLAAIDASAANELPMALARPSRIRRVHPDYPTGMGGRVIQSATTIEIIIGPSGVVSSGYVMGPVSLFSQLVLDAELRTRYAPRPGEGNVRMEIRRGIPVPGR
jgi:hypothetical protein